MHFYTKMISTVISWESKIIWMKKEKTNLLIRLGF